ncbi:hypothetical protein ABIB62_000006 [Mucilaginibacter sp. UYP25]|uniref:hypothetical protein n=1 Tax=unclassified Mucilaginibacter TaxID=2617802 RepID=UPI003399C639
MIRSIRNANGPLKSTIIADFHLTLYQAFVRAHDRRNIPAAEKILQFTFTKVIEGLGKKSYSVVNQLIFLPTSFLVAVFSDKDTSNKVVTQTSLNFKALSYFFRSGIRDREIEADVPLLLLYYEGVLTFYHYLISLPEPKQILYALNEYNSFNEQTEDLDIRFDIQELVRNGGSAEEVRNLRKITTDKQIVFVTHRRATLSLVSWVIFLYSLDDITEERFLLLFNNIELHYQFFEDLLDDVIYIRSKESTYYLGLSGWDYQERENNKIFSPPTPYDWILYGLCYFMLKGESPHVMIAVIQDDRDFSFLPEAVTKMLAYFREHLNKWQIALGIAVDTQLTKDEASAAVKEIFDERSRKITAVFEQLRLNHQAQANENIVQEAISQELVDKFKSSLAEAWKRQCLSYSIFDHFGNKAIKDTTEGLFKYGSNLLLPRFRTMFVENNFQQIYGSSDLGSIAGRRTDGGFLTKVIQSVQEPANHQDLLTGIDEQLAQLTAAGFKPNLIIIPPEFSYKSNLFESPDFKHRTGQDDFSDFGHYKEMPVITFYSNTIRNEVIVTQFENAFELEIFQNNQLYYDRLHIALKELTNEEIDAEFVKDPDAWKKNEHGLVFNDQQAKQRIATSFYLEIWSNAKFNIADPAAFRLFTVNL